MKNKLKMGLLLTLRLIARVSKLIRARILPTLTKSLALVNEYFSGAYRRNKPQQYRKTKMATRAASFARNAMYIAGALSGKFISNKGLRYLVLTNSVHTLACSAYLIHEGRYVLNDVELTLAFERENNLSDVDVLASSLAQQCSHCSVAQNPVSYFSPKNLSKMLFPSKTVKNDNPLSANLGTVLC